MIFPFVNRDNIMLNSLALLKRKSQKDEMKIDERNAAISTTDISLELS